MLDWNVVVEYVPREKNNIADCLARKASCERTTRCVWRLPPSFLVEALCLDALA